MACQEIKIAAFRRACGMVVSIMKPSLLVFSIIIFLGANSLATAGSDTARESQLVSKGTTVSGVQDRSRTTLRQRPQMPVQTKNGYMFWAARLPWSPNAPGD
jgi:hypothetical protein